MPSVINTNLPSLNTQRNLNTSQSSLTTSIQRLSSGLRVNSAKDDAAGLAIAERMNAQVRGLNVAARNANDGVSLAQTAEGALGKVSEMVQRIRELAVQASNATNSQTDRDALQQEVSQLKEEIDRVANTTTFNGTKLLDGSFTVAKFQVGADAGESITIDSIADANIAQLGSVTKATSQSSTAISDLTATAANDLVINGFDVGVLAGTGTTQERQAQVVDAINRISTTTGVSAFFDTTNAKIVLTSPASFTVTGAAAAKTGFDGSEDGTATTVTGMTTLDISGYSGAQDAMRLADSALAQINGARAKLGAVQSRFESAVANIQIAAENTTAARSRIMDTDFAAETANLTRAQILQQAGNAMLSQANQLPQQVLQLLKG
ncbi:MAG TPA: flagellin [Ramlibacter sp.]|jgi:flagellin|uniref:flagellin N-terminal helical domain-containing protein n=1 Tax=Ramlibacter sp. TaxID=1917967 RepID=UPI002D5FAC26|nr:flagellin [Ramlibacter sp.]HZY19148.1 flagellin [Ramlibacter sp.]